MLKKIYLITILLTLLAPILSFSYISCAQDSQAGELDSTIEKVVSDPTQYEGKKIMLEGEVSRLKFAKSFTGKPYTLFELVDRASNMINVYAEGHLGIEKGKILRIHGKFSTEKSYFLFKFKNVVKARSFEILG